MLKIFHSQINSPFGNLSVFASARGVVGLRWEQEKKTQSLFPGNWNIIWSRGNPISEKACLQLEYYFSKHLTEFDIPVHFTGTAFQQKVWAQLRQIPYGEARYYQQVAEAVGNKSAVRAVGNASGRNPIPIIVPCHRVIQKNGKIGGYSGGISIKEWLLNHEDIHFL